MGLNELLQYLVDQAKSGNNELLQPNELSKTFKVKQNVVDSVLGDLTDEKFFIFGEGNTFGFPPNLSDETLGQISISLGQSEPPKRVNSNVPSKKPTVVNIRNVDRYFTLGESSDRTPTEEDLKNARDVEDKPHSRWFRDPDL